MENHGQIYATDNDARRLAPIHDRLTRAGVRNVQVRTPRARADAVTDLDGKIDCVLVDAPCTGIGTWRRNPDAKWRLRPGSLEVRRNEQATVLDRAAQLVKPGGRIVYITCSILPEENDDALEAFLQRQEGFKPVPAGGGAAGRDGARLPQECRAPDGVWPPDDAAQDRHRRLLCRGPGAKTHDRPHIPIVDLPSKAVRTLP